MSLVLWDFLTAVFIVQSAYSEGLDIKLMFKYAEEMIPAGTPVLFRAVDAAEATAPVEVCFSHYADGFAKYPNAPLYPIWDMEGTFEQKVFTETTSPSSKEIYYVSNGTIKNAKQTTIAPYRAYFYGPSIDELFGNDSSGARSVSLVIEDEDGATSALEFVGCDLVPAQSGKTYNLMGTEVGEGYHGIVIKDGKKMLQAL